MSHAAEFALTAPTLPIGPDNQLVVGIMLTNRSEHEMYFNTRFAIVPSVGDVWPTLIGPSGKPVSYALRVRMAPLHSSDFLLLKPNETVLAGAVLRKLFRLNEPGIYNLSARYVSKVTPPELKNRSIFVGELESKPISFTI